VVWGIQIFKTSLSSNQVSVPDTIQTKSYKAELVSLQQQQNSHLIHYQPTEIEEVIPYIIGYS